MDHVLKTTKPVTAAAYLPFELVENILLRLSVPDLLVAAPYVPDFWRHVIENSKEIWKRIVRHDFEDNNITLPSPAKRRCGKPFVYNGGVFSF